MALAPNRFITPIGHVAPDVALRVDEWLRGVPASDTGSKSGPSRSSTVTALPQRHGSDSRHARSRNPRVITLVNEPFQSARRHSPQNVNFPISTPVRPAPPSPPSHLPSPADSTSRGLALASHGKGKEPDLVPLTTTVNAGALETIELKQDAAICGICQDGFNPSSTPLEASQLPGSSSQSARYGLYLRCPQKHGYCLDCLTGYIRVRLEDKEGHAKFPVRCPECPSQTNWEIDDETAGTVLVKELLEVWYSQRLLANLNMFYCPNPKCSEAIEIPEDIFDIDRTECPACRSEICYQCRSMWHFGLACEDAKDPLPDEEALQRLAARNHWRRCHRCGVMVERTEGCNHMTCRCGAEFCFACGAPYAGGCTRAGGCDGHWREAGETGGSQPLQTGHMGWGGRQPVHGWNTPPLPQPQPLVLTPPRRGRLTPFWDSPPRHLIPHPPTPPLRHLIPHPPTPPLRHLTPLPPSPPLRRIILPPPSPPLRRIILHPPSPPLRRIIQPPPTPPRWTFIPLPQTPTMVPDQETNQQEASVVSRPRRLQRRRQDDEPAVIETERPRKLSRPRRPAPIPLSPDVAIPRVRDNPIHRWWHPQTRPSGSARDPVPNQEVSQDARRSSETPTEEEWVVVSSETDDVNQATIVQSPYSEEGARRPRTRFQQVSTPADMRMKPLPPVPAVGSAVQQRNMDDAGNGLRLVFPSRQRRDSEQSRGARRGFQPLRLPRLSLPGRARH